MNMFFGSELHGPFSTGMYGQEFHLDSYNTEGILEIEIEEGKIVYRLVEYPTKEVIQVYEQAV